MVDAIWAAVEPLLPPRDLLDAPGDDILNGDAGDDKLFGGYGNDNVRDGDGDDVSLGGAGDDTITDGAGDALGGDFGITPCEELDGLFVERGVRLEVEAVPATTA